MAASREASWRVLAIAPWLLACGAGARDPTAAPAAAPSTVASNVAQPAPTPPSLLDRMGGPGVLSSIVDELLVYVFADNRINTFFESTRRDPARTKALHDALVVLFCARAGGSDCGPPPARSLGEVHAGMRIAPAHVDAFLEDVRIALAAHHIDAPLREEMVASLTGFKSEIAADPR
jgi:truncated hemoglobin YjbI